MLTAWGRRILDWSREIKPWTNVVGLARTVLAAGTALTLATNDVNLLFRPASGITEFPQCGGIRSIGVFCVAPAPYLELVRWACVVALVIVASGWQPRITALAHWWIAFSLQANAIVIEGGDQVASILALLLLPVALTDRRRWHWKDEAEVLAPSERRTFARILAGVLLVAIRIQVAGIYFHAAAGKLSVSEWADGTVLYYWLTDPVFGAPRWLGPVVETVLAHPAVALVTWSVLVLEIVLALSLGADKRWRGVLLALGISFHFGIALLIGLPSFGLAMTAALILYLRPTERPFSFRWTAPTRLGLFILRRPPRSSEHAHRDRTFA